MHRRFVSLVAGVSACVVLASCAGGDDDPAAGQAAAPSSTVGAPATTVTTLPPIVGVQTFSGIDPGHSEAPVSYPHVPPVGGIHNPVWQPCGFNAVPVQAEKAVHSMEHGAIWVAYRPDLPQTEIDGLAALARSRGLILVSRWDDGLPAPVVVTAWGRQLRLESTADPRLQEFVRQYANQGPEINAPC
ncbi:MAG: DUF3105 domain-containing protein [Acidimicrobiales bacterium]